MNSGIGSQVRSRKNSEPACEVFPVQRESASGKQHQRIENGAPLRACPVGEIEERARSEKVFREHELLRCGIPNRQSPIADEFWKAREAPADVSGSDDGHIGIGSCNDARELSNQIRSIVQTAIPGQDLV